MASSSAKWNELIVIAWRMEMNSYGYEEYKKTDELELQHKKIISLLNQYTDGSTDILIEALQNGGWKLNSQEVHHALSNPKSIKEYLLFRYDFFWSMKEVPKNIQFPIYAVIEPASVCNLRCTMCFQQDRRLHTSPFKGVMSIDTYLNVIDQLSKGGCKAITFAGRGEPLLNQNISKFLEYASGKFQEVKINTNGLLLTKDICHSILQSNVDMVVFSAEGTNHKEYGLTRVGGDFDKLIGNIKMFNHIRKNYYPNSSCQTRVSGVLVNAIDKGKYYRFWNQYVDDTVLSVCEDRNDTYNNIKGKKCNPCLRLWYRTYIWWNGDCSPCDVDYLEKLKFGNIIDKPLNEMWNSFPLADFREKHLSGNRLNCEPCCRCYV